MDKSLEGSSRSWISDKVYVENFPSKNPRWIPGTIVKVTGPLSYEVELANGAHVRRHVDNIRRRAENETENESSNQESHPPMLLGPQLSSEPETAEIPEPGEPQISEQNPNMLHVAPAVFEIPQSVMDSKECFELRRGSVVTVNTL